MPDFTRSREVRERDSFKPKTFLQEVAELAERDKKAFARPLLPQRTPVKTDQFLRVLRTFAETFLILMFKPVKNFQELLTTPFAGSTNAFCWSRTLPGDYAEVVRLLGPGEGIVALDEERLRGLRLGARGQEAMETMLADLALLRDAGRDPVLNIIYGYDRDENGGPVPTDVLSWHVDSAPVEADTWLCTYHGAPSEGLLNEHALRKVDDPKIRAQLLELYHQSSGEDPQVSGFKFQVSAFTDWLTENHYDLHYAPKPGAQPYSFGQFNLWRATCDWPGSPVPPCVHRAPVTDTPRLLLIS